MAVFDPKHLPDDESIDSRVFYSTIYDESNMVQKRSKSLVHGMDLCKMCSLMGKQVHQSLILTQKTQNHNGNLSPTNESAP